MVGIASTSAVRQPLCVSVQMEREKSILGRGNCGQRSLVWNERALTEEEQEVRVAGVE